MSCFLWFHDYRIPAYNFHLSSRIGLMKCIDCEHVKEFKKHWIGFDAPYEPRRNFNQPKEEYTFDAVGFAIGLLRYT